MDKETIEIRWHGRAGQGVVTAAVTLADVISMEKDLHVLSSAPKKEELLFWHSTGSAKSLSVLTVRFIIRISLLSPTLLSWGWSTSAAEPKRMPSF
jgi:hypothetical protein